MERFLDKARDLMRLLSVIGGITLAFMMFLTVADIILRYFRRPIPGTYDIVSLSAAIVIGFSNPFTSWVRGHVNADFLILRFSKKTRDVFNISTRCLGIGLFLMIGSNLMLYGIDLYKLGEVSATSRIPLHPVVCGLGISCFIQCLVLMCDIFKIKRGKYE
jgi:TRAP-type C4-dicarboxylate transport system permease small subunit